MTRGKVPDWTHGPPYLRRRVRAWGLGTMAWVLGGIACMELLHQGGVSRQGTIAAVTFAIFFAGALAGIIVHQRTPSRVRREFEASHGRLCTQCGYDLHALPISGVCPECGFAFDLMYDVIIWRRAGVFIPSWHKFPPGTSLEADWHAALAQPLPPLPGAKPYHERRTRTRRRIAWASVPIAVVASFLAVKVARDRFDAPMSWLPGAFIVPTAVWIVLMRWASRGLQREFEAVKGRMCFHCGYDLRNLPPRGLCPECGSAFDAEDDAHAWARAGFEMPKQAAPPPSPSA